jgi:hypothetical protein
MGRLDIHLDRDLAPTDYGGEMATCAKVALAEDMAEGDFTRLLRAARIVLKLHRDDIAGA